MESDALYAINPTDGSLKWSNTSAGSGASPVLGANGTVYVGAQDGSLYALNPADGSQLWSYALGGEFFSSPAIGQDGTLYLGATDGNLFAIAQASQPVLALNKSVTCADAAPGSTVTYMLAYANTGSAATVVSLSSAACRRLLCARQRRQQRDV